MKGIFLSFTHSIDLCVVLVHSVFQRLDSTDFCIPHIFKEENYLILSHTIRVPKVPFHFSDKLKYEIRIRVLIFVSILKLRHKI